nr:MAG TPA: hypothetical protein [Caudoviricetes sp.]
MRCGITYYNLIRKTFLLYIPFMFWCIIYHISF